MKRCTVQLNRFRPKSACVSECKPLAQHLHQLINHCVYRFFSLCVSHFHCNEILSSFFFMHANEFFSYQRNVGVTREPQNLSVFFTLSMHCGFWSDNPYILSVVLEFMKSNTCKFYIFFCGLCQPHLFNTRFQSIWVKSIAWSNDISLYIRMLVFFSFLSKY